MKKEGKMEIINKVAGLILMIVFIAFIFTWPVQLLWNWLMPVIFKLPEISFWQAMGIDLLCFLLFGNMGGKVNSK
jgi:hypothetical protein